MWEGAQRWKPCSLWEDMGRVQNHLCSRYSWCECVCVCVFIPAFVGFPVHHKYWYPCIFRSHQSGFLSTTMYTVKKMVGPRHLRLVKVIPSLKKRFMTKVMMKTPMRICCHTSFTWCIVAYQMFDPKVCFIGCSWYCWRYWDDLIVD